MGINYYDHGGKHQIAVIWCPKICNGRFLHLSKDKGADGGWIIRDYIGKRQYASRNNKGCSNIENEQMLSLREEEVVALGIKKVLTEGNDVLTVEPEDQGNWVAVLKKLSEMMINRPDFESAASGLDGEWEDL